MHKKRSWVWTSHLPYLVVHCMAISQSASRSLDRCGNEQRGCYCGWTDPLVQTLHNKKKHLSFFTWCWSLYTRKYSHIRHHNQPKISKSYHKYFSGIVVILPSLELSIWFGHLFTTSWRFVDPLKTATALRTVPCGGGIFVLNLMGQKLARFTYSFLHTSE